MIKQCVISALLAGFFLVSPTFVFAQDEPPEQAPSPDRDVVSEEQTQMPEPEIRPRQRPLPFQGSSLIVQNVFSPTGWGREPDLIYGLGYSFRLNHNFVQWFAMGLRLDLIHQITQDMASDPTMNDLSIDFRFDDILQPFADENTGVSPLDIDFYLRIHTPTSEYSRHLTLLVGLSFGVELSYTLPALEGFEIGVSVSGTRFFHDYTSFGGHSLFSQPLAGDGLPPESIASSIHWNDGPPPERPWSDPLYSFSTNVQWLLRSAFWLDFHPTGQLSIRFQAMFYTHYIYELPDHEFIFPEIDPIPITTEYDRSLTVAWFVVEAQYKVITGLDIAFGSSIMRNLIEHDASYRLPVTADLYIDVRFRPAEIVEVVRNRTP